MKHASILFVLLAACTAASPDPVHNSPVEEHREFAIACSATSGNQLGVDQCLVDADCPSTAACVCAGSTNEGHGEPQRNLCVAAGCHIDADCGVGGLCSPSIGECGNGWFGTQGFACRTDNDTCGADQDCVENDRSGGCTFVPEVGHWACSFTQCAG